MMDAILCWTGRVVEANIDLCDGPDRIGRARERMMVFFQRLFINNIASSFFGFLLPQMYYFVGTFISLDNVSTTAVLVDAASLMGRLPWRNWPG
jgi:hypothetical protein